MDKFHRTLAGYLPIDWRAALFKNVSKVVRGSSPRPAGSPKYFDGDYLPWVTVADITSDSAVYLTETKSKLTEEGSQHTRVTRPGTLMLTNSGATLGVPKISSITCGANDGVAMLLDLDGLDAEFAYYYLLSKTRYFREVIAPGIGQPNLNTDLIGDFPVPLPPVSEQRQIANVMSLWDHAIEYTEKLIENSKAQKNALIHQLLTGKKRFPSFIVTWKTIETRYGDLPHDWSFVPIGDIAIEQTERAGKCTDLPVLSCSKYDGFVDSLRYFKKKVYSDDTSNYKVVRRGCYGFPSNHIEEGSIGYQEICEAGIVSPIYSVFKTSDDVHDGYLYRLLKTEHYRQIFQASTNASVDRRGSLRWKEFSKIRVPSPSLAEQLRISETIDAADGELANIRAQLIKLKTEKRALMQQLLTGKRRVKVAA